MNLGLRGYRTLVAGIIGMGLIAALAIHAGGAVEGAIAQIAGIVAILAGRSMSQRDDHSGGGV